MTFMTAGWCVQAQMNQLVWKVKAKKTKKTSGSSMFLLDITFITMVNLGLYYKYYYVII